MKKIISIFVTMALLVTGIAVLPAVSAEELLPSGYQFVDIAHHGNTYVAMAKDSNLTVTRLYYSNDSGLTWTASANQPMSNGLISNNKPSQQQLVWWADKNVFVAHGAASTYTSADGVTWSENANINWTANTYLTAIDKYLILSGGSGDSALNAQDNLTTKQYSANKFQLVTTPYLPKTVAATPKDANGDIYTFALGSQYAYYVKMTPGTPCAWEKINQNVGGTLPSNPYDMVYASNANQFLAVDGTAELFAATDAQNFRKYTIKDGVNVTAVNANDAYIVVGMSDGTMYYTENAAVTADTEWTEIPPQDTAGTEAVTNIEFSDDGSSFVALGTTQIYKGSIDEYYNINDYIEIGSPTVSGQTSSVFDGVRLIGGTYSATANEGKGLYIVYGDTAAKEQDDKFWGEIFISENGTDWEQVYKGYTFSKRNFDTDGETIKSYNEVRNGAAWWESQGKFLISASTQDNSGVVLVSEDGKTWSVTQTAETDFRLNTDIAISGDKLYTTNNGRQFRTYTAWNKDSMTYVGVTSVPGTWYMNQLSVSGDADPAALIYQNGNGAVRDNTSTAEAELDKWHQINAIAGAGAVTDSVYSKQLGQFVAVSTTGYRTSIVSKDGTVVQGPVVSGGIVCNAIDTNDEVFMFAAQNGNVYTAPDTADFGTASLAKVPAAASVDKENEMNVTNVFKAGDKFIATVSDNTDSDVLFIGKNSSGAYEYVKASESGAQQPEVKANAEMNINLSYMNKKSTAYDFIIIAALYSDNTLVQMETYQETASASTSGKIKETLTLDEDLPDGAELKIFVWNNLNDMVPLKPATSPLSDADSASEPADPS